MIAPVRLVIHVANGSAHVIPQAIDVVVKQRFDCVSAPVTDSTDWLSI